MFLKGNTLFLIGRLNKAISHEAERFIPLVMFGEDKAIFKQLTHHRRKYLSDGCSLDEAPQAWSVQRCILFHVPTQTLHWK